MPTWRKLYHKTTESLDVNDMPDDFTRLLWVLLPLGLDREGRGLDNPSWVKAKLMPLRTDIPLERIAAALDWFGERGMIQRYQVESRSYFAIPTWHKYQGDTSREAGSSFPPPPAQDLLMTNSRVPQDPVVTDSHPDSDSDSDLDADADTDSDSPAPPGGEELDPLLLFRQSYDLPRLNPTQVRALGSLVTTYGADQVCQAITWAVNAGIPQARLLRAISSALPGWRSPSTPDRFDRKKEPPSNLDPIDELIAELQQQEEQEANDSRQHRNCQDA